MAPGASLILIAFYLGISIFQKDSSFAAAPASVADTTAEGRLAAENGETAATIVS
jgi:hypothetical protein